METTTNYKLPQWVKADQIKMDDFNGAFGKIDAALKANADAAASKASAAVVTALAQDVGAGGKNCRIAFGSYVGTGTYGADAPISLNFPFRPVAVFLASAATAGNYYSPAVFLRGCPQAHSDFGTTVTVTWTDGGISFCSNGGSGEVGHSNKKGETYYYVAVGESE